MEEKRSVYGSMSFLLWGSGLLLLILGVLFPMNGNAQVPLADTTAADTSEIGHLYLDLGPEIDSMYVVVDRQYDQPRYISNRDSVSLPAGEHFMTLATRQTLDLSFSATIQAGMTDTVQTSLVRMQDRRAYRQKSSYPVLHHNTNLIVVTDRASRVFVDGEFVGQGRAKVRVKGERHHIRVVHSVAGTRERIVTVQAKPPRLTRAVMYNKPSRRKVRIRSVIPGLAQLHKGHDVKGISFLVGFFGSAAGAIQQSVAFADRNEKYEDLRAQYKRAESERQAYQLGNETERWYESARSTYWRRNILTGAAAGIFLYSLFDAWIVQPEGGYRTPVSERTRVEPLLGSRRGGFRLVVHF